MFAAKERIIVAIVSIDEDCIGSFHGNLFFERTRSCPFRMVGRVGPWHDRDTSQRLSVSHRGLLDITLGTVFMDDAVITRDSWWASLRTTNKFATRSRR